MRQLQLFSILLLAFSSRSNGYVPFENRDGAIREGDYDQTHGLGYNTYTLIKMVKSFLDAPEKLSYPQRDSGLERFLEQETNVDGWRDLLMEMFETEETKPLEWKKLLPILPELIERFVYAATGETKDVSSRWKDLPALIGRFVYAAQGTKSVGWRNLLPLLPELMETVIYATKETSATDIAVLKDLLSILPQLTQTIVDAAQGTGELDVRGFNDLLKILPKLTETITSEEFLEGLEYVLPILPKLAETIFLATQTTAETDVPGFWWKYLLPILSQLTETVARNW